MIWGLYFQGVRYIPYSNDTGVSIYEATLKLNYKALINKHFTLTTDMTAGQHMSSVGTPTRNSDGSYTWSGGSSWISPKTLKAGTKIKLTECRFDESNKISFDFSVDGMGTFTKSDMSATDFVKTLSLYLTSS